MKNLGTRQNIWKAVQILIWIGGITLFITLLFFPKMGIHILWNILIPLAPVILVFQTGLWRNICPVAYTSLLPAKLSISKRIRIPTQWISILSLIGIVLLLLIIPLRHVFFDKSGLASALFLVIVAFAAILMGLFFERKSAWCSGICPIHAVEKLYGYKPTNSWFNAHCTTCVNCTLPCPDSTPGCHPILLKKRNWNMFSGNLLIGMFPGYIWGWFQVKDYFPDEGIAHLVTVYFYPFSAGLITLSVYLLFWYMLKKNGRNKLLAVYAALAVSCYYWFRIPQLFGFGPFPGDGMLVDLTTHIPAWFPLLISILLAVIFFWWIVVRTHYRKSWLQKIVKVNS